MKIKDVITETGLTDRAIRLYIANDLVAPSCSENYAGRKNIDFTNEDVDALKNIATLRKAGFSIAQIKVLLSDTEKISDIIKLMISEQEEKAKTSSEVAERLKGILNKDDITIETICDALNNFTANKAVPEEDTEPSLINRIMRIAFPAFGILCIIYNLPSIISLLSPEFRDLSTYLYPKYESFTFIYLLIPIMPIVLSLHFIFSYNYKKYINKKAKKIKAVTSVVLSVILLIHSVGMNIMTPAFHMYGEEALLVSKTNNIDNYMICDDKKAEITIAEFLPETLPEYTSADYNYFYKDPKISHEPPMTIVYLDLWLNDAVFEEMVNQYKNFKPADSVCEPISQEFASWTILFYREDYEEAPSNYTPVFAYNDFYKRIRFICHYGHTSLKGASRKESLIEAYKW
ncbi:MAG: MerR family transcriptional regulator [Clostridia bacterium]|nr:MerR family transcriptional regulator [Clostridia bacterium]